MPVRPNVLERLLLFRLHRAPAPVLDLFGAAAFEAVTLAVDLGVFDALDEAALSADEVADRIGASEAGTEALLRFLAAQGYVERGDGYRNTAMTREWLTDHGRNVGPWLTFWAEQVFPFWRDHLGTAVLEGEPPETLYEWLGDDREAWATTQRGFEAAAGVVADEVARKVTVPDGARVLDLGGGHGRYAAELLERHPGAEAVVFDADAALDVARERSSGRLSVRAGDYETDDLGGPYDLVLLFNVVHAHDGAECVALFERVADALAPGGRVAVLDQLEGTARTPVGRAGLGFVGLTYLATLGATVHPFDALVEWLEAAGFEGVRRTAIRRAGPGNWLVEARLPDR